MRKLLALIAAVTVALTASGCNTVNGIGEDIEAGGEAIQDVAD